MDNAPKETSPPVGKSRLRTGLLLATVSTLLCLLAIEVALRLVSRMQAPVTLEELDKRRRRYKGSEVRLGHMVTVSANPRLVYELIPNLDVNWKGCRVQTNSLGYRDDEFTTPKPQGVVRIAVLGDSSSFGWAIEKEDRYSDALEWALNGLTGGRRVEVMNFGIPGYNTAMEYEVLKSKALALEPDVVVLQYEGNDTDLPNFVKKRENVWRLDRLYLWDFLRTLRPRWAKERALDVAPELLGLDLLDLVEDQEGNRRFVLDPERIPHQLRDMVGEENCRRWIGEIGALCKTRKIPAAFLLNPAIVDHYSSSQLAQNIPKFAPFADAARKAGFVIADPSRRLMEFLEALDLQSVDLFVGRMTGDGHPSPPRCSLLALAAAEALIDRNMLPAGTFPPEMKDKLVTALIDRAEAQWTGLKRASMPKLDDSATTILPQSEEAEGPYLGRGWYDREFDLQGLPFRWCDPRAVLRLPPAKRLVLEVGSQLPRDLGQPHQAFLVDGNSLDYTLRRRNGRAWFDIPLPEPPPERRNQPLEVRFRCKPVDLPGARKGESRELGLQVYKAIVERP